MNDIVIRTSVWKSAGIILVCLAFVFACIFTYMATKNPTSVIVSIIGMAFFGLGAFVLLYQVLDRRPRIIISETGIIDRTLRVGEIGWGDINSAELRSVRQTKFVALKLNDTKKYLSRLSNYSKKIAKLNKALGFGELTLNLSLVDMKPIEVYKIVERHISATESDDSFSVKALRVEQ